MTSFNTTLLALRERLAAVRYADRARLARELDRLFARKTPDAQAQKAADALGKAIDESVARVERLRALPLKIDYDAALPIVAEVMMTRSSGRCGSMRFSTPSRKSMLRLRSWASSMMSVS